MELRFAMKTISIILAIVCITLTACSDSDRGKAVTATPSPQSTATQVKVLPTPSSPGNSIVWDGLEVTLEELEISQDYLTDFGSTRVPPAGNKFLWVHVGLKNTGEVEMDVPLWEHFSILYTAIELKPTYGHRANYVDYTTLGPVIFPAQELNGWLRFDIPTTAELKDLRFVFLPESAQVGASYNSPNYPYADDKPTYVWSCEK